VTELSFKGVILAGGQGTRFRPLTYYFQKCMIPVGENQKPVLEYIVRLFAHHEFKELILLVGYKHQQIKNYFNEGGRFGVKVEYVLDDPDHIGSAGAIINAYKKGIIHDDDNLIVYYGDILSDFNLKYMVEGHLSSNAGATVALSKGYKVRVGTAEIEEGLIARFIEKPELELPVSVGILILSSSVMKKMVELYDKKKGAQLDLMGDVIPYLIQEGVPVKPYISDAFWYDLGSLERYERFETEGLSRNLSYLEE
jgi:mannose-1-phosphate guanylyltransferase